MPEEKVKKTRLGQAATEFNVSMDRIVDVLKKNGLEINSPTLNSKLSEEKYALFLVRHWNTIRGL